MGHADRKIEQAFHFLLAKAREEKAFTRQELAEAAEWTQENTDTNISKRLSEFIRKGEGDLLFADPVVLRVRLADFTGLFRQKQHLFAEYIREETDNVLVYEFFMPLANEDRLRDSLDSLFFSDTIEQIICEIGVEKIRSGMKLPDHYTGEQIARFVCESIDQMIGGYSLYHVNGRFRADRLRSRNEYINRPSYLGPYIIDETTAVVRFVLPVEVKEVVQGNFFEWPMEPTNAIERAEQMRWLFLNFFAEAVARTVKKEDEIWLLESGMRSCLYKWVRKD